MTVSPTGTTCPTESVGLSTLRPITVLTALGGSVVATASFTFVPFVNGLCTDSKYTTLECATRGEPAILGFSSNMPWIFSLIRRARSGTSFGASSLFVFYILLATGRARFYDGFGGGRCGNFGLSAACICWIRVYYNHSFGFVDSGTASGAFVCDTYYAIDGIRFGFVSLSIYNDFGFDRYICLLVGFSC